MTETNAITLGSAEKDINLPIPNGWHVFVTMTTQSSVSYNVVINGSKVYFNQTRKSTNYEPPIYESFTSADPALQLQIITAQGSDIKCVYREMDIFAPTQEAPRVAYTLTLCAEDWTDYDYNDLFIQISAWKNIG